MASNSFGQMFKITTWGESHGPAVGVVIDGCPSGVALDAGDINAELQRRAPGQNPYTSPRSEPDTAELCSGVFDGFTTGAPIAIIIRNRDADSSKYEPIKNLYRPGHANFTYLKKYGNFDYRGGGRASARETACRVAAGAVAKQLLALYGIEALAYLEQVSHIKCSSNCTNVTREDVERSALFCPEVGTETHIKRAIEQAMEEGDSLGGVVAFIAKNVPVGLGDPVYEKIEAKLASAMMSIPATKGFEIGKGFASSMLRGSEYNDSFFTEKGKIKTKTNHAGGILGGITNGMPLYGRVAFKPTSSIAKPQKTLSIDGQPASFELPPGSRHDPCVTIRAVPVVEAMLALVLADVLLADAASGGDNYHNHSNRSHRRVTLGPRS